MDRHSMLSDGQGRGVLVTGCSSGIGRAVALCLADHGFTVFATVRRERDYEGLASLGKPSLVPFCPLDLRNLEHIPSLVTKIQEDLAARGQPGLYAIVNNGGAGSVAPLELLDLETFRGELEARLLGPVALAQALLPSLRRGAGRLVWIATPALMPIPFVGSIHVCDYAANCVTRTFALELAPWKIPSVFVRCGGILTSAPEKNARELEQEMAGWSEEKRILYRDTLEREKQQLAEFDRKRSAPTVVAENVLEALRAPRPKRVYRAGYLARAGALLGMLPESLVDWIMSRR
ncbi:MAG TPA: SDR family NAD(P)-dependent oxidoreductase [Spirochaetia bacterium]|nr:SDR family NAD(P)-dependent oxidoreductase [Spirochaetia bacterium]